MLLSQRNRESNVRYQSGKGIITSALELKQLLGFAGKDDNNRKLFFIVEDGYITAFARTGTGAELFVRGDATAGESHDWSVEAAAIGSFKLADDAEVVIALTKAGNLGRVTARLPTIDSSIELLNLDRFSSTQVAFNRESAIPARPSPDFGCPYSMDLDWGLMKRVNSFIKTLHIDRARVYTPRDSEANGGIYVEFGTERPDGLAPWFATFAPYTDEVDAGVPEAVKQIEVGGSPNG
jgi:hypothetical protein